MEKDLRAINKLARKINDEKLRGLLDEIIDKVEADDEGTEEPTQTKEKVDATPEPVEVTDEQPKLTPPQTNEEIDLDDIRQKLGLEKVEALVVSYDEKIRKLEEEVKKSRNSGYSPGNAPSEPDTTVDDIFARLKTNHIKR